MSCDDWYDSFEEKCREVDALEEELERLRAVLEREKNRAEDYNEYGDRVERELNEAKADAEYYKSWAEANGHALNKARAEQRNDCRCNVCGICKIDHNGWFHEWEPRDGA